MGKRHQASRRRAYGRRQHEVRERSERPERREVDAVGLAVLGGGPFDGFDEALMSLEVASGGRAMHAVTD